MTYVNKLKIIKDISKMRVIDIVDISIFYNLTGLLQS